MLQVYFAVGCSFLAGLAIGAVVGNNHGYKKMRKIMRLYSDG